MALNRKVPFFMHDLGQEELREIASVFKGPILTTGNKVQEFEDQFSKLFRVKYGLGVTSCTAALQLVIQALGIKSGDEIITTPLTFLATASAIEQAGAKPVFCDVEKDTGNLDPDSVSRKITKKTRAVLAVHLYGLMCDMRSLERLCKKKKLYLIEDAAHCIEGERDGVKPGQKSDAACFSFYATKNMTCGEGGAIVTRHQNLYKKLKLTRLHGMTKTAHDRHSEGYAHWDMTTFGWKYNMDNIQAAILLPQIKRLQTNYKKRKKIAEYYDKKFKTLQEINLFKNPTKTQHAHHLYVIRVESEKRDRIIKGLRQEGVDVMVNYNPVHLLTYYKRAHQTKRGQFPIAESLGRQVISLPLYPKMTMSQAEYVAASVIKVVNADR